MLNSTPVLHLDATIELLVILISVKVIILIKVSHIAIFTMMKTAKMMHAIFILKTITIIF